MKKSNYKKVLKNFCAENKCDSWKQDSLTELDDALGKGIIQLTVDDEISMENLLEIINIITQVKDIRSKINKL